MTRVRTQSRRRFLTRTAAASIALPYVIPARVLAGPDRAGANERINLAWIGVGRRAHQMHNDLRGAPSVPGEARVVAMSDVYLDKCHLYLKAYEAQVLGKEGGPYGIYQDYREMLERKDIVQNWIDCIKSRERPAADVEIGHRSCTVCQLGNIARRLGRKLEWDPAKEIFPGDDEANAFLSRPQREGYRLPELV